MKRVALAIVLWIAGAAAALAQNVTVIGPITPGDCTMFSSTTVIKDGGIPCPGSGGTLNLPNGTTATTQSPFSDNTTKVATDAFVQGAISLNSTHFSAGGTSTGSANAQVIASVSPPVFSLVGNPTVTFNAGFSNSGSTTLNVASSGVISILKKTPAGLVALVTGDIIAGQQYLVTYDGTQYEIQTPSQIVNAQLGQMAANTTKCNNTGGAAIPIDCTQAQLTALINPFTSSLSGAVPASGGGTTNFLRADGSFAAPTGTTIYPGNIGGLRLSNDVATPLTVLDISAGVAVDSINATTITLGAFTKSISATWASGTGNGGRAAGLALTANTWYSVFLVLVSGTADVYFDIPSVVATTPPAGTTAYRHLGWFYANGSSQISGMECIDDTCMWTPCQCNPGAATYDYFVTNPCNAGASAVVCATTVALTHIPPGAPVTAILDLDLANISIPQAAIFWVLNSPNAPRGTYPATGLGEGGSEVQLPSVSNNQVQIQTNAFGQVSQLLTSIAAGTGSSATSFVIESTGWIYHRTPPAPPSAALGTPTSIGVLNGAPATFSSQTFTTTAAITRGNSVGVCIATNSTNTITVTNVSDGFNTYYRAKQLTISANTNLELWIAPQAVAVASSATMTITFSGSSGASAGAAAAAGQVSALPIAINQPTNLVAGTVADQTASAAGTTGTSVTATTGTLAQANELAFGCSYQVTANTYNGATGFTNLNNGATSGGNGTVWLDYRKLAATTAVAYTPTWASGSVRIGGVVATFKGN